MTPGEGDEADDREALESQKLRAEIAYLKAQKQEVSKGLENAAKPSMKFWARAPVVGGFILASAGLGGFGANVWKEWQVHKAQVSASRAEAIANLESPNASQRSAAVFALQPSASDPEIGPRIVHALVVAFGYEESALIRQAMIDVFRECLEDAVAELQALRKESNERAQALTDTWGSAGQVLSNLLLDEDASPELVSKSRELFRSRAEALRKAQWSFVYAADALRVLQSTETEKKPIDLSNGWFRSFSFATQSIDLEGAIFDGAGLFGTDFFDSNLTGASFKGAELVVVDFGASVLVDADFSDAEFYLPEPAYFLSERERAICIDASGTDFSGADLVGSKFVNAKIHGVSFKEAANLRPTQFQAAASFTGAILPDDLASKMGHDNPETILAANIQRTGLRGNSLDRKEFLCER